MNKARKIYIDIIRIIGAFMVLYIHSGYFHAWEHKIMPLGERIIYMFPAVIVPSSVPLFMMISGSLLLKREDSIKDIWKKRITKVMLLIFILTALHYIFDAFHGNAHFSKFLCNLINLSDVNVVYWFMYWWLSFSIMLPCYQQIAKGIDKEHIIYLMFFCLFFNTVFPFVNLILDKLSIETLIFSSSFSIPIYVSSGFFYPFLGYYLDNKCKDNKLLNNSLLLTFIMLSCIIFTMFLNFYFKVDDANIPPRNIFTPIITICIYQVIKNVFKNINIKPDTLNYNIITFFGSNMIGVYAFQVLFAKMFEAIIYNFIKQTVLQKIEGVLYIFIAFMSLSIITFILKKIPIFKKALC